jgi:hypothetical protein
VPHQRSLDLRDGLFQDRGYPSDEMICWLVSARVGNVKNNDPSLIKPIAA